MASLDESECHRRFSGARHAVLATVHAGRGVDAVPVVFAIAGNVLWTPVDTVKPKRSLQLSRLADVEADERVCLLVEQWDEEWGGLWWVRAHGSARLADATELRRAQASLAGRYDQYCEPGAVAAALRIEVTRWQGWAASG